MSPARTIQLAGPITQSTPKVLDVNNLVITRQITERIKLKNDRSWPTVVIANRKFTACKSAWVPKKRGRQTPLFCRFLLKSFGLAEAVVPINRGILSTLRRGCLALFSLATFYDTLFMGISRLLDVQLAMYSG